jgi:hypothetical protein
MSVEDIGVCSDPKGMRACKSLVRTGGMEAFEVSE